MDTDLQSRAIEQALLILEGAGLTTTIIMTSQPIDESEHPESKIRVGINGDCFTLGILLFDGAAQILKILREKDPARITYLLETALELITKQVQDSKSQDLGDGPVTWC